MDGVDGKSYMCCLKLCVCMKYVIVRTAIQHQNQHSRKKCESALKHHYVDTENDDGIIWARVSDN